MKTLLQPVVRFVVVAALLLPARGQGTNADSFSSHVPFKFQAGGQTFKPGTYQFTFAGVGLLAMRDHRGHIVARLTVRPIGPAAPSASKLIFHRSRKHLQLEQIQVESLALTFEVLGAELAIPSAGTQPHTTLFPADFLASAGSRQGFR